MPVCPCPESCMMRNNSSAGFLALRPRLLTPEYHINGGKVFVLGNAPGQHECSHGQLIQGKLAENEAHLSGIDVFSLDEGQNFLMKLGTVRTSGRRVLYHTTGASAWPRTRSPMGRLAASILLQHRLRPEPASGDKRVGHERPNCQGLNNRLRFIAYATFCPLPSSRACDLLSTFPLGSTTSSH